MLCNDEKNGTIREQLKAEIATLTEKQAEYILRELERLLQKEGL